MMEISREKPRRSYPCFFKRIEAFIYNVLFSLCLRGKNFGITQAIKISDFFFSAIKKLDSEERNE